MLDGVGRTGLPPRLSIATRRRVDGGGFRMPEGCGDGPAPSGLSETHQAQAAAETSGCDGIPADTGVGPAYERDQQARRRGHTLLNALAAMQHALLAPGGPPLELDEIAALLDGPPAATPGLQAVIAQLSLRVRIELARGQGPL